MTPELLQAATGCTRERATLFAPLLAEACAAYSINTRARLAAFLAQVGHECGSFRHLRELWGPTPAQLTYEGRKTLGNTEPGDGERYKGHGLIQITGRHNHRRVYERLSRRLGAGVPDFEAQPERLSDPRWAVMSAADFWDDKGCNAFADADDFEGLTRRINGGLNGLSDRMVRWKLAKLALGEGRPVSTQTPPEKSMPITAIAAALLPTLIESIPLLGKLFGSGSAVSERNVKATEIAFEVVTKAVGAVNLQDAAEKIKADPAMAKAATAAVEVAWLQLTEAGGGGIAGARVANAEYQQPGALGFWLNPAFWVSVLLIAMPFMLLVDVFYVHPAAYSGELRTQIVTAVLLVIGMVGGYWIGSSMSSAKKDERIL